MATIDQVDACLPQTQCTRCGYPSCIDYAEAVANKQELVNRCAPGGDTTLTLLSKLTEQDETQLADDVGGFMPRQLATIDEPNCIGCLLCIKACPVDAIVGANKLMHTIIHSECTGCELCIPVCPTDCITMHHAKLDSDEQVGPWPDYPLPFAKIAKRRHRARIARQLSTVYTDKPTVTPNTNPNRNSMQADILAAIQRRNQG